MDATGIPIIDLASFRASSLDAQRIGAALDRACGEFGFFYVTGHGIDPLLSSRLMSLAREFFALPLERKLTPGAVKDAPAKIDIDEKLFRWMMNEDAMATEKLAEGIRTFAHDLGSLRKVVDTRLAAAA